MASPATHPVRRSRRPRRLLGLILGLLLAGCGAPPAPIAPSPPRVTAMPSPQQAIQLTMHAYAVARTTGDATRLPAIVDTDNPAFWSIVQRRFAQATPTAGTVLTYTVQDVAPRPFGFVGAHVQFESSAGARAVGYLTFRQLPDGRWVLSEPSADQLTPTTIETPHFQLKTTTWADADDVNARLAAVVERAYANVHARLSRTVPDRTVVRVFTVASSSLTEYGQYQLDGRTIWVMAPQTYMFGFADPATGWEPDMEHILTHEYAHLVHDRRYGPTVLLPDWMREGLAEDVADTDHRAALAAALAQHEIIPLVDPTGGTDDLAHLTAFSDPERRWLAYGYAQSVVRYIVATYGLDGFWRLCDAYNQSHTLDAALQTAFHVSFDAFDQSWRHWLDQYAAAP